MAKEIENPFAAQLRIRRGNTPQGVFAEQLGLKQAVYSHYENRRREPTLDELCRIARVLGITPNDLLGFSSASSAPSAGDVTHGANSPIIKVNGNHNNIPPQSSTSSSQSTAKKRKRKNETGL
ncbi:MAG: helix-turn-helix transcriptional regulator [Kiritimatiellae bacterium]|nr:helix-turn-helix transcriptional regulator [Kiritimatiellia bacterium]